MFQADLKLQSSNGFTIQSIARRGSRSNFNNLFDDFIDDSEYFKFIPKPAPSNPIAPVVPQGIQAQPNNNNLVSLDKAPEPNNAQISGLLKQFRRKIPDRLKKVKSLDKRDLLSKAEKGVVGGPVIETQKGQRQARQVASRKISNQEILLDIREKLDREQQEREQDPFRNF